MSLQSLGYTRIRSDKLEDWYDYATKFLGLQLVERSRTNLTFRMDDRKQRVVVENGGDGMPAAFGWETADAQGLDRIAARLDTANIPMRRGSAAEVQQRGVTDMIAFRDPAGNHMEVFHGAEIASEPFKPGRNISGFRTGSLGIGHAVLQVTSMQEVMPFYTDVLGFRLTDYVMSPFKVFFFHINSRHHSLALVEWDKIGIHHLMMELYSLDDVGQGYDIAQMDQSKIATTLGRHINDLMTSFYTHSPSGFMIEYGWGGKSIDPNSWQSFEVTDGPSFWGHERTWLSQEGRDKAKAMRMDAAQRGVRKPVEVVAGNYSIGPDICPWFAQLKGA
jgi:2,3-dihydroxybiphenyl 1,2-dioxygenase